MLLPAVVKEACDFYDGCQRRANSSLALRSMVLIIHKEYEGRKEVQWCT